MMEKPTHEGASTQDRLEAYLLQQEEPDEPEETAEPTEDEPAEPEGQEEEAEEESSEDLEGDATEEDQEPELSTDELASYLGVDPQNLDVDEDGKVLLKTKIDGKEGTAKLDDVLASYQLKGHLDNQNREVSEQKKQLEQKAAETEQAAQQRIQQLDGMLNVAYQQLVNEYQNINWDELRQEDPAEFSAKQYEFQQRQAQIQQGVQYVQQQRQAKEQQTLQSEAQRIPEVIPEWSDEKVAEKERNDLRQYVERQGINPEVTKFADGLAVLRKAMLYDQLQQTKADVSKKVKKAPKIVKSGQSKTKQERKAKQSQDLRSTVKKSGGKQGLHEYLMERGIV